MKAWDVSDLEQRLKDKGLTAVEGLAEITATAVLDWLSDSCMADPNVLIKGIGVPAVAILRPLAMDAIAKIDGK